MQNFTANIDYTRARESTSLAREESAQYSMVYIHPEAWQSEQKKKWGIDVHAFTVDHAVLNTPSQPKFMVAPSTDYRNREPSERFPNTWTLRKIKHSNNPQKKPSVQPIINQSVFLPSLRCQPKSRSTEKSAVLPQRDSIKIYTAPVN